MSGAAEPALAAGAVLFRRAEEGPLFLLLENRRHGTWGFPKGHAEAGETLEACAARELAEEVGPLPWTRLERFHEVLRYHVDLPRRDGPGEGYDKEVHYYLGEAGPGEVVLSREHARAAWLPYAQARRHLQFEDLRRLLDAALARIEAAGSPGGAGP